MLGRVLKAIRLRLATRRALATARADSDRNLTRSRGRRVLVLCYGNIYRSPFAAESLRTAMPELEIRSAGFHSKEGRTSPDAHVRMSAALGVDLLAHRSRRVRAEDIAWADLIVIMDRLNWARLQELQAPADKVLWLGSLKPGEVEIPDPYGLDPATARAVVERLAACSAELAARLKKL